MTQQHRGGQQSLGSVERPRLHKYFVAFFGFGDKFVSVVSLLTLLWSQFSIQRSFQKLCKVACCLATAIQCWGHCETGVAEVTEATGGTCIIKDSLSQELILVLPGGGGGCIGAILPEATESLRLVELAAILIKETLGDDDLRRHFSLSNGSASPLLLLLLDAPLPERGGASREGVAGWPGKGKTPPAKAAGWGTAEAIMAIMPMPG